jgi:hypothetical protein
LHGEEIIAISFHDMDLAIASAVAKSHSVTSLPMQLIQRSNRAANRHYSWLPILSAQDKKSIEQLVHFYGDFYRYPGEIPGFWGEVMETDY